MAQGQTKLLYPGLAGFYETMLPIAGALVRIVVGIMFLMHVSTKFKLGADARCRKRSVPRPALAMSPICFFNQVSIEIIVWIWSDFAATKAS